MRQEREGSRRSLVKRRRNPPRSWRNWPVGDTPDRLADRRETSR